MARGLATWHAAHLALVALHVARCTRGPGSFTRVTPSDLYTWHALAQGAIAPLVEQLREVRLNTTADADDVTDDVTAARGRVVRIGTNEDWYDLLLAASEGGKLTVADFGASWCAACNAAAPLFASMSLLPQYENVTFAHIDADDTPVRPPPLPPLNLAPLARGTDSLSSP